MKVGRFSHAKFSRLAVAGLFMVSGLAVGAGLPPPGSITVPPLPSGGPLDVPLPASGSTAVASAPVTPLKLKPGAHVDLRFIPVSQVVDLVYAEMLKRPYVLCPELLKDDRNVSFRYDREQGDIRDFMVGFLASIGYRVDVRGGVDYVVKAKDGEVAAEERVMFVYQPKYRSADYLSRLVQPLFKGRFTQNRSVAAPEGEKVATEVPETSAAGLVDQSADVLLFAGSAKEVAQLRSVLAQLDTAPGQVVLKAWVYEVSTQDQKQNGFELAASVLGGRLGVQFGVGSVSNDANALTISAGSLKAAISALDADSRFHVVTSPNVRVASGKHARLNIGQSVPVVSSVSYTSSSGVPVQSIQYQDAGVIFDVQPTVRGGVIDTAVTVEISDFQRTTTGVNTSPTKNTRKSETSMAVKDGEVIVMGGLSQSNVSSSRSGVAWLPSFMDGRNVSKTKSDIVLVLQVEKLDL
ncbi:type II secretory pathway protein [Burkholderia cenocepacia]|uniref:type II secretion system protein GspD n=1 Tax=Burkholderia cenocepacia TaxID=95486 RepID=UPI001B93B529|nr:type II secretory pathway protein [Burkholderia cenocepacia]MBR8030381.1 type II secretory pathway protein [Burkholderia cenocepacia]MBR8174272.1 type II secretory pathway protein [Burkholderia cenocepacia]